MKTLQELIDRQKRSKIDNVKLNNTMYSLSSREHYEKQLQELKGRFQGKDEAIIFWYEIVNNDDKEDNSTNLRMVSNWINTKTEEFCEKPEWYKN
jgi:hypothetical protein